MRDDDSFRIMTRLTAFQVLAVMAFLVCIYALVGTWDDADQIAAEAEAKVVRAERAAQYVEALRLSHPLPYAVSVRECLPSGRGCTEYRYYIPAKHEERK